MKIWAYAICWNEEMLLPYYIRHYAAFCEKIIIYDNKSTDNSQRIIRAHPKCELRTYDSNNKVNDELYIKIKNNCWKEARGKADFVIVGDMDEFLYHKDMQGFLELNKQYSIFHPPGFEMASLDFPQMRGQLWNYITDGLYHVNESKKILFNPNKVKEMNWFCGCHHNPKQKARPPFWLWSDFKKDPYKAKLKLLHFKYLGEDYVNKRHNAMAVRLSPKNRRKGWGFHYSKGPKYVSETVRRIYRTSKPLNL